MWLSMSTAAAPVSERSAAFPARATTTWLPLSARSTPWDNAPAPQRDAGDRRSSFSARPASQRGVARPIPSACHQHDVARSQCPGSSPPATPKLITPPNLSMGQKRSKEPAIAAGSSTAADDGHAGPRRNAGLPAPDLSQLISGPQDQLDCPRPRPAPPPNSHSDPVPPCCWCSLNIPIPTAPTPRAERTFG